MDILLSDIKKKRLLEVMPFSTKDAAIAGVENDSVMHPEATSYASHGIVRSKIINENYLSKPYELVLADTTNNSITINLPDNLHINNGEYVEIFDFNRNSSKNNIIVNSNGSTIEFNYQEYTMDLDGYYIRFVYNNGNYTLIDNIYASGGIGSGSGIDGVLIESDTLLRPNELALVDTSLHNIHVTLPYANELKDGDVIEIFDFNRNAYNNNISIFRNDNKIEGLEKDLVLDVNGYGIRLVYINGSFSLYDNLYAVGGTGSSDSNTGIEMALRDSDFDAVPNQCVLVDTTFQPINILLPHDDDISNGDILEFCDFKRHSSQNPITIQPNSNKIEGEEVSFILDISGYSIKFVYYDGDYHIIDNLFATGSNAKSAYDIWLGMGNTGTPQDFLDSLKAVDGKSAYEYWLENGNTGTEQDFIDSLQPKQGMSAYDLWLDQGNIGSEEDFLRSLRGDALKVKEVEGEYNIQRNDIVLANTLSGSVLLTLPSSGEIYNGDFVQIIDTGLNAFNNNIIIDNNNNTIDNKDLFLYIDVNGYNLKLVYKDGNYIIVDNVYALGGLTSETSGGLNVIVSNTDFIAAPNTLNLVDTASININIDLPHPENINNGDIIEFYDHRLNANTNNMIISGNGSTIAGETNDFIVDINGYHVRFLYKDNNYHLIDNIYAVGGFIGKSAYQSWLDQGNTGTENDFIESLKAISSLNVVSINSNYNANPYDFILTNTTDNHIVVFLPNNINNGEIIEIFDISSTADINNIILNGNESTINGQDFYHLNIKGANVKLVYNEGSYHLLNAYDILSELNKSLIKKIIINDNYSPKNNEKVYVDTSLNEINILLPLEPYINDEIQIIDIKKYFNINNVILHGNGKKIDGDINNKILNENGLYILLYVDDVYGWSIIK